MIEFPVFLWLGAFAGGGALGTVYFLWLWRVARRMQTERRPGLRILAGTMLRMAFALGMLYLLSRGEPVRLTAALLGFLCARMFIVWRVRRPLAAAAARS